MLKRLSSAFILFLLILAGWSGCRSTTNTAMNTPPQDTDPRWAKVDSLSRIGQYASALELTNVLLADAKTAGNWREEFKAWMMRSHFQQYTGVEMKDILNGLNDRVKTADAPLKQLLHSALGQSYWSYYQQQRWQVLQRTNVASSGVGEDIETWGQRAFMDRIIMHYRASLEPRKGLQEIKSGELGLLLAGAQTTIELRPTLYDLLAHQALQIFTNSETRLAEPAWRFRLDDPRYFKLYEDFAMYSVTHRDSTAWEFQALQIYQDLTRQHLSDDGPAALVDLDMNRLEFVRSRSSLANKDSLYLMALEKMRTRIEAHPSWAEVTVAIAQWHAELGGKYQRLANDAFKWEKKNAQELCNAAIKKFPDSFGAQKARVLQAGLERASMIVRTEEAVEPNKPFKVALSYSNLKHIWLRIVEDPVNPKDNDRYDRDVLDRLVAKKPIHSWNAQLPDDGDLQQHLLELAGTAVPEGHYALLVSSGEKFQKNEEDIVLARFWSTDLSMVERQLQNSQIQLMAMHRQTGAPLNGIAVEIWQGTYGDRGIDFRLHKEVSADMDGRCTFPALGDRGQVRYVLKRGTDRFVTGSRYYGKRGNYESRDTLRTFLFLDRAIYRPGQPIHYKGIMTAKRGKAFAVKTNYQNKVELFDVNGELVATQMVTTDKFGSFNGSFTAPEGTLTGQMRISANHGSQYFRVEEYKRPQFEVTFEPMSGTPSLGEEVVAMGKAMSYAGVPLDNSQVQWTVKRQARMPWWCWGWWRWSMPWGTETEIASGVASTNEKGEFDVKFIAQADPSFPKASSPNFNYRVDAAVTDVNGETQSGNTSVNVGYTSLTIEIDLEDAISRITTDSLRVQAMNLNGQPVDVPIDINILPLQAPETPLRDRLWEVPDRFVMTATEHKQKFPQDVFKNENEAMEWPTGEAVLNIDGWKANGKKLPLKNADRWNVGHYLIEATTKDPQGREVKVSKAFVIYDVISQRSAWRTPFHVEPLKTTVEPGTSAEVLFTSALKDRNIYYEIERNGEPNKGEWMKLSDAQQLKKIPVTEMDRGGFAINYVSFAQGRAVFGSQFIEVPWTNKDLKVEWMSFRDKLLPGQDEQWRLKITGNKGNQVAAQLLAGMYDASLDQFVPHSWNMSMWPTYRVQASWGSAQPFGMAQGQPIWRVVKYPQDTTRQYPAINSYGFGQYGWGGYMQVESMMMDDGGDMGRPQLMRGNAAPSAGKANDMANAEMAMDEVVMDPAEEEAQENNDPSEPPPIVRTDFRETAFFFPELLTDRDGSIVLKFDMPDALTRWNFMGLAHTTDMQMVNFTKQTITQRPMMVVPNLPRFLREGDRMVLTAKVNVLEGGNIDGIAKLELFDPFTNKSLNKQFGLNGIDQTFVAGPGQSASIEWTLNIPEGVDAVAVRITAKGMPGPSSNANYADGEERVLPILTDKVLVTESLPLPMKQAGTHKFTLDKLVNSGSSSTLRHQSLSLEFTPNPAWYAVQALPYMMEFPHECAEQVFSRYYANRIAGHIVEQKPAIKEVFAQWKEAGPEAFLSALEKNTELKNIILAETPWVMNARSERERKERVALLFDMDRMASEERTAFKKLMDMQRSDGAWSWFSGMYPSRYITQHIVAGMGHLERLGAADMRENGQVQQMLKRAVQWLDADVDREYQELRRAMKAEDLKNYTPGGVQVHCLYTRSFFPRWSLPSGANTAAEFYKARIQEKWLSYGLQEQAMIALALDRMKDKTTPGLILKSLKERATIHAELGMYWKSFIPGLTWQAFPTETHALMIEAFNDVAHDDQAVRELRVHLLKLKQTTDWQTTKATAEACYALLLTGDDWLEPLPLPVIKVGDVTLSESSGDIKQEAGSGYFKKAWTPEEIKPDMGNVTVTTTNDRVAWGALHWQYFETMDKVTPHESPFNLKKDVMLERQTEQGPVLLTLKDAGPLHPGDKLTIRIEMRTDRWLDYVHMKDLRGAGMEPIEKLSGYRYQGGLGYYQSIRDAAMHFFFDRVPPGTYVFEYGLRVTHKGEFSNGITAAMCMYAPEFSTHSQGDRITVKE